MPATDRAATDIWHCAAKVLGIPLPFLRRLTPAELRALLRRTKGRVERTWTRSGQRLDVLVAALDLVKEHRLP